MVAYATSAARPIPEDAIVRYATDVKASTFKVRAFAMGMLSAFGHSPTIAIRDFEGNAQFTEAGSALENARLEIIIRAKSLEVVDDISDKDRREMQSEMNNHVLETDRFPEIRFESTQVTANGESSLYRVTLNGELSLHGVTRPLPVSARVVLNGDSLRASGEFSIRQSDYEIAPVKAAAGAIKLKDELKFTFDIVARKQK